MTYSGGAIEIGSRADRIDPAVLEPPTAELVIAGEVAIGPEPGLQVQHD